MSQFRYPTIDLEFIERCIKANGKLKNKGIQKCSNGIKYTLPGRQAFHKRTITIFEIEPGQIGFEQSIAIAIRFGFLPKLLEWLEKNRNWKAGGYFVPLQPFGKNQNSQ